MVVLLTSPLPPRPDSPASGGASVCHEHRHHVHAGNVGSDGMGPSGDPHSGEIPAFCRAPGYPTTMGIPARSHTARSDVSCTNVSRSRGLVLQQQGCDNIHQGLTYGRGAGPVGQLYAKQCFIGRTVLSRTERQHLPVECMIFLIPGISLRRVLLGPPY